MESGPSTENSRLRIFPPVLFVAGLVIGLLLQWIVPLTILPFDVPRWPGALLLMSGILLALWGRDTMAAAGTSPNPASATTTLVTTGPFRFSRNPLYVASTLAYLGVALLVNSLWVLLLLAPILLVMHFGIVRGEERYLAAQFGDAYRDYCARVRRYL